MTFIQPYSLCHYCQCPMDTRDPNSLRYRTLDHRIPLSRGGKEGSNIVKACRQCNQTKGNMTDVEFFEWIARGRPNKVEYLREIGLSAPEPAKWRQMMTDPAGQSTIGDKYPDLALVGQPDGHRSSNPADAGSSPAERATLSLAQRMKGAYFAVKFSPAVRPENAA